jgi:trk system potassium uptake protein TrkA
MTKKVAVIGLGDFGTELAVSLAEKGAEVLAIDEDLEKLDDVKERVTHTVRLDSTEEQALRSQGLHEFDAVVVGIGDDFEATLLTVAMLQKIEVKRIIVRATTETHERILNHLGIKETILPAVEAADRLANSLMFERVVDSFAVSSDYTIMEVNAPKGFIGHTLEELELLDRHALSLITIRRTEKRKGLLGLGTHMVESIIGVPPTTTRVERGDILVLFGKKKDLEKILKD